MDETFASRFEDLRYRLDVAARTYAKRGAFFRRLWFWTSSVGLLSSASAVIALLQKSPTWVPLTFGVVTVIAQAIDRFIRPADAAVEALAVRDRSVMLDAERIRLAARPTAEGVAELDAKVTEAEKGTPPVTRALWAVAYNEYCDTVRAAPEDYVRVPWLHRITMHLWDHAPHRVQLPGRGA